MNRRDELIQHAFGELPEDRSRRLEASEARDPRLAREADALRQLRADLRGLRDIPECQLSAERMRDAVLRSEMKARPRLSPVWLGAPVAAGLAVLGMFLLRADDVPQLPVATSTVELGASSRPESGADFVLAGAKSAFDVVGKTNTIVPTSTAATDSPATVAVNIHRRPVRISRRTEARKPRPERFVRESSPPAPVGPPRLRSVPSRRQPRSPGRSIRSASSSSRQRTRPERSGPMR